MTYSVGYAVAWINAATGVVCGGLASAYLVAHPSWLTSDVALTCGVVAPLTVALGAILPSVRRTPRKREMNYLNARMGVLPDDLQKKHPPAH